MIAILIKRIVHGSVSEEAHSGERAIPRLLD